MDTAPLYQRATPVVGLAESARDLLALAFGPRGAFADITWLKIDLGEQGMDAAGELYAANGKITITFTLPHVPMLKSGAEESDDDPREIPF